MTKSRPSVDRLKELFSYDPEVGELVRNATGSRAGWKGSQRRYRGIKVDGVSFQEHIAIWAIVTGEYPSGQIDHRDRDGLNNRWANLRLATASQQQANRRVFNPTGYRGVYRRTKNRWAAVVNHGGRGHYLGMFSNPEDAAQVVDAYRTKQYGEFASF